MSKKEYRCAIISDFTADNFGGYLNNDENSPAVKGVIAPFGQVARTLMDKGSDFWKNKTDFAVVWTRAEGAIESFNRLINYEKPSMKKILEEVDEYASLLLNIRGSVGSVFIPTWVTPPHHRGFGMLDMKTGIGIENAVMRMNLRLSDNLDGASNYHLLNTRRWVEAAGKKAFSPELWYMGKIAFGNEVFMEAVKDIKSALMGISGDSKKLIILDLDDTLWEGVIGDVGWKNIKLGGHDPVGEAYLDFQRELKALTNRGILLGIVSRNEESVALEAIDKHPEMALRSKDFAGWRINWQDKAQNIIDLVSDLNLGLQSVVFIDDNPAERSRVREALPEVTVPEWPENKMLYKSALLGLRCFDAPFISRDDSKRTKMYVSERQRRGLKLKAGSVDQWLKGLKIKVRMEELNEANLQRAAQLLNKTNQMNLTTRRMTESELMAWAGKKGHKLWIFRVSDKFGDSGIAGIAGLEVSGKKGRISDFILSCRVVGRHVEETMLAVLVDYARSIGLDEMRAEYAATENNKPCLRFFVSSGFKRRGSVFSWKVNKKYRFPRDIEVRR